MATLTNLNVANIARAIAGSNRVRASQGARSHRSGPLHRIQEDYRPPREGESPTDFTILASR
jgi:hypothetical protein